MPRNLYREAILQLDTQNKLVKLGAGLQSDLMLSAALMILEVLEHTASAARKARLTAYMGQCWIEKPPSRGLGISLRLQREVRPAIPRVAHTFASRQK